MATFTRTNAWNNGGTFDNPDLLWYAKGVAAMQSRSLDDQNSWWFFAAIHGENIALPAFPGWGHLPSPPSVPTTPLPSRQVSDLFWNQCQHQSWYFPPWHRGYLIALEAQIRAAVIHLEGPETWALPYWNYLGPGLEFRIPPAFTQLRLPDGSPNPLYVNARYGPFMDGRIFVQIPPASAVCQTNTIYTGNNRVTPSPGYGGPKTRFNHLGGVNGNLEQNPHNLVHVDVGGRDRNRGVWGLMADPKLAGLDPIFYLHHSNIDRMWAAWNEDRKNSNPTDPDWLNGPAAIGQRPFVMPMPGGTLWRFTPADVNSLGQLNYIYDDLSTGISAVPTFNKFAQRLMKLGAAPATPNIAPEETMDSNDNAELVGANAGSLRITSFGARATVTLNSNIRGRVSASLAAASETNVPDRVYLQLENVRGDVEGYKLNVSVNGHDAGTVALFGVRNASQEDGEHGGGGLTILLDITDIVDDLFLDNALDADSLDVRITPNHAVSEDEEITVGRVGIYRQEQQ